MRGEAQARWHAAAAENPAVCRSAVSSSKRFCCCCCCCCSAVDQPQDACVGSSEVSVVEQLARTAGSVGAAVVPSPAAAGHRLLLLARLMRVFCCQRTSGAWLCRQGESSWTTAADQCAGQSKATAHWPAGGLVSCFVIVCPRPRLCLKYMYILARTGLAGKGG